ncbi:MAG TPA: DinB family protein [Phycisphaerales bacterium]|nr:DinB family protein [Phycisphaerales bacterium]
MTQATTATGNMIARSMLEEFEREVATTRRFLERVPGDRLSWRPHAKSMSAGQLAHHIAETPGMALQFGLLDRAAAPDFGVRTEARSVPDVLAVLDAGAAYVRETLLTVEDARMNTAFTIDMPDGSVLELPRHRFFRTIMLNHWYHHRGQLGVYLRMLDVPVPSSYGPSGDEQGGI